MDHAAPTSIALRALQQRSAALRALFDEISVVRMHGVPILNPALRVATVGFEVMGLPAASSAAAAPAIAPTSMASTSAATAQAFATAGDTTPSAVGILITPWFMNLVCFSLMRQDQPALVGSSRTYVVGAQSFDFIAAHEERFGNYAACSLFSPMFEFKDQATAVATAEVVLAELRKPPEVTAAADASVSAHSASSPSPATAYASKQVATTSPASAPATPGLASVSGRRGFLFGRRSATPGAAP